MNAQELLDEWTQGEENGMRPQRIQALRDDLMEATDEYVPRRIPEIRSTITDHPQNRGVFTRKLREAVEGSDEGSDDTETQEE